DEMKQWLSDTVARIARTGPRRFLELGVGTGAILFNLAPHADAYWGTDISDRSLGYVRGHLAALGEAARRVTLARREATDFDGGVLQSVDVVILNSVIQYFPSAYYLLGVLEGAIARVA